MVLKYCFSACCSIEKIFNLKEGLCFLEKYKNRKTGFVKAVKEMTAVLLQIKRGKKIKEADETLEKYKVFSD